MSDEVGGLLMTHFIGLRSKAYTYKVHESKDVRKCKGIKFNVVKNKITFEDYYNSLFKGEIICADQTTIRSRALYQLLHVGCASQFFVNHFFFAFTTALSFDFIRTFNSLSSALFIANFSAFVISNFLTSDLVCNFSDNLFGNLSDQKLVMQYL